METHLVGQSSLVVGDKMKVCLEEIQVAVMYILQRSFVTDRNVRPCIYSANNI